ncbi:MAG: DegT/DnrJ/EryC1/StrS family aminotransferase [Candidatus Lokiarchaeota archaeon]|nr:DegT/DnrJ/EryC1/StrS family aminotransferase [Candidatus Lokiarchaeota archaeon]MBD3338841.1 DegT/DnrJ/EryC1/StrS family aminotransferase [Candidatus Lokiarchaeota archaeon]
MPSKKKKKIKFPEWPVFDEAEIISMNKSINSKKWWCGSPGTPEGENVWEFQKEFAEFQESKHCVAVFNGTVALETALLALGIGLGDEVIVSDFTFVASASAVVATNAVPIFCDINPTTLVMEVSKVEDLITERTKAIIPVHLGGNPVKMDKLMKLAEKYNLKVLEDCAHAHGTRYKGKMAGNWGHAGTFSFQASKVLTSGEGGAIITNNDELVDSIYSISDCGRRKGQISYQHFIYGSNFRMSEFQVALLLEQMKKFPSQHHLRNKNARYLREKLNTIEGLRVMEPTLGTESLGWYIFPVIYEPEEFRDLTPPRFYTKLIRKKIPFQPCYIPLHSLECFKNIDLRKGIDYSNANWGGQKSNDKNFPVVSDIYKRTIQFPHYILLSSKNKLDYIVESIRSIKNKN